MKHLCLFSLLLIKIFAFSIGFNYNDKIPREFFYTYDYVVINDGVKIPKSPSKKIVYLSIEEQEKKLNKSWIIGYNKKWKSYIYDIGNINYQKYLLNKLKKYSKKYDGFFFDTLDSFELTKTNKKKYIKNLEHFLAKVRRLYPHKFIIFNRGFEIINKVKPNAIVAENLFYDDKNKPTSKEDQQWLIQKLNYAKSLNIIPIVIDYVTPFDQNKAIKIAKKIKKLGFIPFVSDLYLTSEGVSTVYNIKRKILVITDNTSKTDSLANMLVAMPLEFYGYIPDIRYIDNLPNDLTKYHYIIPVLESGLNNKQKIKFKKLILKALKNHIKILFLGGFGIDDLSLLNITANDSNEEWKLQYSKFKPFESNIILKNITQYYHTDGKKVIVFRGDKGHINVAAAKTNWGGYFIQPFIYLKDTALWKVNPFDFIPYMLDFKNYPFPDFTTENGMRIWFFHIDGDGFVNRNDFTEKMAGEMMYEEFFTKYNLPFSESIIEGEVAPYGVYPKDSKEAIKIVKKIFKLKNVEPATHTFSHPFDWRMKPVPRLPIKGYKFSYKRELTGSVNFLSKLIHKKVNMVFWSGNCNPWDYELGYAYKHHIYTINALDTYITYDNKFLFNIAPLGIYRGKYFQVSGQMANENIFTNLWENKLGYIKAIQTIQLTDNPRRLKPIDIYLHNYTGAFKKSIYAAKQVLNYSLKQEIIPMFTSDFIHIALDYEYSYLLKDLDGNYIYKNSGNLRTLKIKGKKEINIKKSIGVIGYRYLKGYTYIALDNSKYHKIVFGKNNSPYLIYCNKRLISHKNNTFVFDTRWGKMKCKFYLPKHYKLKTYKKKVTISYEN